MVLLNKILFYAVRPKKPLRQYLKGNLLDSLRIYVRGGRGGNGIPKFGGVGGNGGNVFVVAKENLRLEEVRASCKNQRVIGNDGRNSTHNFILGTPGEDVRINVPVGITVYTDEQKKLGELNEAGDEINVAYGGTGGHSKNGFLGTEGQAWSVKLELKLIADVGLVGFPNAGKSTLLKAISYAKPKIASYPFTTIRPNVGVIWYKDYRQISMADLPGLIEGAYMNRGMGHRFLRHVERTKLLLFVIDINGFQLSPQHAHRSCIENIILLNKELELYDETLLDKPAMIVINKMDTEGAVDKIETIKEQIMNLDEISQQYPPEYRSQRFVRFDEVIPISAKQNVDVEIVKEKIRALLDLHYAPADESAQISTEIKEKMRERGSKVI